MTEYEKGQRDGFCGLEAKYPHNLSYMRGHKCGEYLCIKEAQDTATFEYIPVGIGGTI